MKAESWNLNLGTFLSLLGVGICYTAFVIVFVFQVFNTKAEAQSEAQHIKEVQDSMREDVQEIRADVKELLKRLK